jgi:RNA polymerase sigma-70 factor (ECF subfamily)
MVRTKLERKKRLETWMDLYTQRLVRLAYTYVREWTTAEDKVQDTFVKVYEKMDQFKEDHDPFPWLARIVINECRMAQRKGWREIISALLPERADISSEDTFFVMESNQKMYDIVLKLLEPYRTPIILYYFEELSLKQISEILGINEGTVKSRLARGRKRLRKVWEEEYHEFGQANQSC